MDALSWPSSTAFVVTTTAVATATLFVAAKAALWPRRQKTLRGPLKTIIPRYAKAELAELAYQPDQFPGAKDVETPVSAQRMELVNCGDMALIYRPVWLYPHL